MKYLLTSLLFLFSLTLFSQTVEKVINLPTTASASPTRPTLIYMPDDYGSTSTHYPLLLFFHGSGESGTDLSQIYNSTTAGGPPYLIEHGGWPESFTNPKDGKAYKFIVISPQSNNSWSSSGDEADYMIKYMVANYRVDPSRIYLTGLSAGGGGDIEYAAHLDGNEDDPTGANNHTRTWKAAAIVPMSAATNRPDQSWGNTIAADSVKVWGQGDPNNDTYGEFTMDDVNYVNIAKAGFGLFTPNNYGHGGWANIYIPTFRQTINGTSMNIYEWMLSNSRGAVTQVSVPLSASAGSNQTITLPTSSLSLIGTATAATGQTISSSVWTEFSGPAGAKIASAFSMSTTVSSLVAGTYDFRFAITQGNGQTMSSDAVITVNPAAAAAPPTVNPGGNQTITLPTSSLTLSGSATAASGKTITAYAWSQVSGPNTAAGSSPSSASTGVTGLIQGTYTFRLTVTQSDKQTASGTLAVTVNAAVVTTPPPTGVYGSPSVVAGANQTVARNTANLTSTYKITGANLSSVTWSKLSAPGQKPLRVGVLGSSYPAGGGASTYDSSFMGRFYTTYHGLGIIDSVINLSYSGFNVYQVMPTGYIPSASINAKLSPSDTPRTANNITALLKHNPNIIILCFPTNGYDVLTIQEVVLPFQTLYDTCTKRGIQCYITTTSPRTDQTFSAAKQVFLQTVRDTLMNRFGAHCIDIYDGLNVPGTTQMIPSYMYYDSIHVNDAGHKVIFNSIAGANVFQNLVSSTAVIGTPSAQNTTVSSMPNGINQFEVSVKDSHSQYANGLTIITTNASATPVANAGAGQTITLPNSVVTLSAAASTGTISSYAWTKVSGPNTPVISSPSAVSTTITGLVQGTYSFQVSLNNGVSTAKVTVTVNAAATATVTANAGSSQSIALPTSIVTLTGSSSTGTVTSYAWTKLSGPNTPTIVSPSSAGTSVTGLVQGTYTFQLSLNGGVSTSQVTVTVNAAATVVSGSCKGTRYIIAPDPVDSSVYITHTNSSYQPGDTLILNKAYSAVDIEGLRGTSSCPIVIMNQGIQVLITKRMNLDGCQYVKVTGSGSSAQYGFLIQQDPQLRQQSYNGIQINDLSKDVEVERVYLHNVDIGIVCETNEDCNTAFDYPNWTLDSMSFHDNKIVGTWNEGMYLGNTSPDNASYDLRPVVCNGVTYYYAPMKNGYCHVYNNIVDSTGRGGIQLSNAASGVSEINNNTVKHTGMNGDDAQGSAITLGLYTRAYVHDNTISNTFTWGIASIGAGATNVPLRIENNTIDSSGYLITYNLATTDRIVYDPRTEPTYNNLLTWQPQSMEIDTRPRLYTTDTPNPGTAVKGQDSTQFWIKSNVIGKKKNATAINIDDDYLGIQKTGNEICGNTNAGTGTPATITVAAGVIYSSTCTVSSGAVQNALVIGSPSALTDSMAAKAGGSDSGTTRNMLALYPNPSRDNVSLEISNNYMGAMSVRVMDPSGAIKRNLSFQKDQAFIQVALPTGDLPKGIYFVRVQIGNWSETRKLLKL